MNKKIIVLIIFLSIFLSSCIINLSSSSFFPTGSTYTGAWDGYLYGTDNIHGYSIIRISSDGTIQFKDQYNLTVDFYRYDIEYRNILGNDVYEASKYVYDRGDSVTYYLTIEFVKSSFNESIYTVNVGLVEKRNIVSDKIYSGIFDRY
ncbi:hypothetical protein [Brachyspira sp. SAP_772]|uniref:hypothetical protein n=1 Tax=Brachyspira sp. SAP_772 TaxID=2608385 RepID=UPI0012F4A3BE|nr:hypothetical protein [Brachyspira sp. SAP_772]